MLPGRGLSEETKRSFFCCTVLLCLFGQLLCFCSCKNTKVDEFGNRQYRHIVEIPSDFESKSRLLLSGSDQSISGIIRTIKENSAFKNTIGTLQSKWKDRQSYYRNMLTKVKVTEDNLPWLYEMVTETARALKVKPPGVFVVFDGIPDAYVVNVQRPALVIHSALIGLLDQSELLFIVGHELAHIKFNHVMIMEFMQFLKFAVDFLPSKGLRDLTIKGLFLPLYEWVEDAEISADYGGLMLVSSPEIAASALIRMISGLQGEINVVAFRSQLRTVKQASGNSLNDFSLKLQEFAAPTPFVARRVEALYEFLESDKYSQLHSSSQYDTYEFWLSYK